MERNFTGTILAENEHIARAFGPLERQTRHDQGNALQSFTETDSPLFGSPSCSVSSHTAAVWLTTMRKIIFTFLFSLLLPFGGAAQKSTSKLLPAHASALQQFLSKHSASKFLSEGDYTREALKDLRKRFGARFLPFFWGGGFNHDGKHNLP